MDYQQALRYLNSFTDFEKKPGGSYTTASFDLRRPAALLDLLGSPQLRFPSVVVAGTKGKGSTSAMLASILRASGRVAGLYSQPHLHTFRERIRVDGRLIGKQELAGAIESVVPAVDGLRRTRPESGPPTTYEVTTAAAMLYFASRSPDLVVLEVGLGGRLDAVNVVTPLLSVITSISLDHVQLLGTTLAEIAGEKAGIIKSGGVVVSSEQAGEAMEVIRRVAEERGARLVVARPEVVRRAGAPPASGSPARASRRPHEPVVLRGPSGTKYQVRLSLLGAHQVANATTAIAVSEQLGEMGFPVEAAAVERGLAQVEWPGRLEVVSEDPMVVVDGAHNGDSARKLAAALPEYFAYRRLILVLGTSADKDLEGIVSAVAPMAYAAVATRSRHARAANPELLASIARRYVERVEVAPDFAGAMAAAIALAAPSDLICVTGSLFIVAGAREHFGLATERD